MVISQPVVRRRQWLRPPRGVGGWRWQPLVPAAVWTALTILLFVYFRYVVASPWHGQNDGPWPDGVGQSWSQYKVTIWGSCALIGLVVAVGSWLATRASSHWARGVLVVLLVAWCGTGLGWNFFLAKRRGELLLAHSGSVDPLAACRAMRAMAATLPASDRIYLDWKDQDGAAFKYGELMAYFLYDHPLVAAGVNSPFLALAVAPEDAGRTLADCQWVLRYRRPAAGVYPPVLAPGGMMLEKVRR